MEHGIKGAPGAMIIHCDKSQNVEQTAKERDRQRQGEEPTPLQTRQRFLDGMSLPEVTVVSNTSGPLLPALRIVSLTCSEKRAHHSFS